MSNNLGEIFYNGRVINLKSTEIAEMEKITEELKDIQVNYKEKISQCLEEMRGGR